jgi:hypothetical protein
MPPLVLNSEAPIIPDSEEVVDIEEVGDTREVGPIQGVGDYVFSNYYTRGHEQCLNQL